MVHPLVEQLRFARSEFRRGLDGVTEEDAQRRLEPSNCLSWSVGHMAWQEERYFVTFGQGRTVVPRLPARFGGGSPPSTPTLAEAWAIWEAVTAAADPYLDALTAEDLLRSAPHDGQKHGPTVGTMLLRTTYHYWFHNGENAAFRQQLGHRELPVFVGDIDGEAPYRSA